MDSYTTSTRIGSDTVNKHEVFSCAFMNIVEDAQQLLISN